MMFFNQWRPLFSSGAKHFFFSLLNESKEMGVINNAGGVSVSPISLESSFEHQRILALRPWWYAVSQPEATRRGRTGRSKKAAKRCTERIRTVGPTLKNGV
jgi:hypothetical protein